MTKIFGMRNDHEERLSAVLAIPLNSSMPVALSNNKQLIIAYFSLAIAIAALTRRNQVLFFIVSPIVIFMIHHDAIIRGSCAAKDTPDDFFSAPMTAMRTWANRIKQSFSRFHHIAVFCRQWMTRHIDHTSGGRNENFGWSFRSRIWAMQFCEIHSESSVFTLAALAKPVFFDNKIFATIRMAFRAMSFVFVQHAESFIGISNFCQPL